MLWLEHRLLHFYFCVVNVYRMWILHLSLYPAAVCVRGFSIAGTNHEHTACEESLFEATEGQDSTVAEWRRDG